MYTKKEWSIRKNSSGRTGIYIEKFGFVVFAVSDTGDRDVRKTINESLQLIAAAPDLLEACKKFIDVKTNAENDDCYSLNAGLHSKAISDVTEEIKTAINKVTGE